MKKNNFIDSFNKNKKYFLIATLVLLIFHKYIVVILLGIIFTVLGTITVRVTKFVPHISVETISASAILFGFVWGWKAGLIFGVGAGLFAAVYNGFLKLTTIVNSLFMGLCGVLAALFDSLGYNFTVAFLLTFLIRSNLGFFVFQFIKPDFFENMVHSYGDALFNVLIVLQIMRVIFEIMISFQ